jgi:hypothetical protein
MRAVLALGLLVVAGCGGGLAPPDVAPLQHAVLAQKSLTDLCRSDAGCTPGQCAAVSEAVACNVGSVLYRNGAPDMLDGGGGTCHP